MKTHNGILKLAVLLICANLSPLNSFAQAQTVHAEVHEDGVSVFVGETLFTRYLTNDDQKYPYFYPVNGPFTGESVTTETSEPYPHHHSLFFGCDRVNGGNYWQEGLERGRIASTELVVTENTPTRVVIENRCEWIRDGAESPFFDTRTITITAPSKAKRFIDFEITLEARMPVTIEKTNHALFSARMTPALSVEEGGVLVNAEGERGEDGTWGKKSAWCDYFGEHHGETEGLAIMSHPENRWFPEPWFTRNYGFFSPTPMQWLEDGKVTFAQGETLTLKYRVVVHAGDTEEAEIKTVYANWESED